MSKGFHGIDPEEVPEALRRADQDSLGKATIARQVAGNQLLSICRDSQLLDCLAAAEKVHDEERLAIRLGIRQVTLRLARVGAGGLDLLVFRYVLGLGDADRIRSTQPPSRS